MLKILTGDCLAILPTLPAQSVQCCITSPPYWGLRDYGTAAWEGGDAGCDHIERMARGDNGRCSDDVSLGVNPAPIVTPMRFRDLCSKCGARRIDSQMGLESTPEEYLAKMVAVFREVWRVLKPDGTLFINMGDSYFGGGRGGGGSFSSERPGWSEVPCGIFGKEPANSPKRDCLCESLCDACRKAYQIGRFHSDSLRVPKLSPSPSESNPERRESQNGHLATSDSAPPPIHSERAKRGSSRSRLRVASQPPDAQESNTLGSSQLSQDEYSQNGNRVCECQLCGCSLTDCVQESADRLACTCDTVKIDHPLASGRSDKSSFDKAYPSYTNTVLKAKDLVMMPARLAMALQADGWYLRSDIIWHKPNPMPESVTDRPTKSHEYIFLLTKNERYYYDADAIREPMVRLWDKSNGGSWAHTDRAPKESKSGNHSGDYPLPDPKGANKRTVWTIATQPYAEAHFATFPEELPKLCILAGSRLGDCVLDPFAGSGTTGKVALELGRKAILIELNPAYVKLANDRTTTTIGML